MIFSVNSLYQIAELLSQPCIRPDPVQAGICLKDVKMRVHCLLLILILLAQAQVGNLAPLAVKSLEISVELCGQNYAFQ